MTNPIYSSLNIDDVSRKAWRVARGAAPNLPAKLVESPDGVGRPGVFLSVADKRLITNMLAAGERERDIASAVTEQRLARLNSDQRKSPLELARAEISPSWLWGYLKREAAKQEAGVVRDGS